MMSNFNATDPGDKESQSMQYVYEPKMNKEDLIDDMDVMDVMNVELKLQQHGFNELVVHDKLKTSQQDYQS